LSGFAPDGAFRMVVRPEGRVFLCRRPDKAWDIPGVVLSGFAPDGAFRMVVRPEGRVFVFRLMGVPNEADGRVMKIAKASVKVE